VIGHVAAAIATPDIPNEKDPGFEDPRSPDERVFRSPVLGHLLALTGSASRRRLDGLIDVNLGRATLKDADLPDAELRGCFLVSAQATDCHFDNAKFTVAPASKNAPTLEMAAFRGCSFAGLLGLSRQTASALLGGTGPVSAQTAVKLGTLFGNSPQLWMNLQSSHDLWTVQQHMEPAVLKRLDALHGQHVGAVRG
jgi:addiction module HigA family antidote